MTSQPVLIIGAGIAGLTLAIALARRGIPSQIYEQAARLSEAGAGLQLSPNVVHILDGLGISQRIATSAVTPDAIILRNGLSGNEIVRLPLGNHALTQFGAAYRVLHRADLQIALLAEASENPLITLHLNCVIDAVEDTGEEVRLAAYIGDSLHHSSGQALVGADGVRSVIRQRMLGGLPAQYSGYVAWRATIPSEEAPSMITFDGLRNSGLWLGPHAHFLHYPLRSGREFNIVAIVEDNWQAEGWSLPGLSAELMAHFRHWSYPARQLLERPRLWIKWALCGVDPEGPWVAGRIALIGDAAHAMLPFAAQGAAAAIEDAAVLARRIADTSRPVVERLTAYEVLRKPRVRCIVETTRANGRTYHLSSPLREARDMAMRLMGGRRIVDRMDWIYRWRDGE